MIEISERGPWRVIREGERDVAIMSDDFTHDVILSISGDFADQAQRDEYARQLVSRMNRMPEYDEPQFGPVTITGSDLTQLWPTCHRCGQRIYFGHECQPAGL